VGRAGQEKRIERRVVASGAQALPGIIHSLPAVSPIVQPEKEYNEFQSDVASSPPSPEDEVT